MSSVHLQTCLPTPQEKAIAVVGGVALAALVTGVVLAILQTQGTLSTVLMATGGGVAGITLVYIAITYCSKRREEQLREKLGFIPREIPIETLSTVAGAQLSGDVSKMKEAAKPVLDIINENWNKAKTSQQNWTLKELGEAIGFNPLGFKLGMRFLPEEIFVKKDCYTTDEISQFLQLAETAFK